MPSAEPTRRDLLAAASTTGLLAALPVSAPAAPPAPPPFTLGIVTYNIAATWDVLTILRILKAVGLAPVELRTTHAHGVEPSLNAEQRRTVRKQFADAGVPLWGLGTVCEFHSPDAAVVEKNVETCKQFLQLCADVGGKGVKVRPNGLPKEVPVEKTLEQIGKALARCGSAAADLNLEVWLEVHGPGSAHPPHIKTIMEHCSHPRVGVTWNSNKTDVQNGSVAAYFDLLKPWIRSCHINDLYGDYPYRELFARLRAMNYDRVTLVEIGQKLDPVNGELLLRYYKALWRELCT